MIASQIILVLVVLAFAVVMHVWRPKCPKCGERMFEKVAMKEIYGYECVCGHSENIDA